VKEVFDELHAHGITTVGSWIGGWDFHDKENIEEDLEYFIALEPTRSQLFPLYPPPGTALYERLASEGRLPDITLARTYWGRTSGAEYGFPDWKKNFTEQEIQAFVDSGHRRLYEHAGPSVMRALRVHLNGYEFCKNSSHEILRERRSELHRAQCAEAYRMIDVCEFFAPNAKVRAKIEEIRSDYRRLFGEPTIRQRVMSKYAFLKGCLHKMGTVAGRQPPAEPPFRRYEYAREATGEPAKPYVVSYPHPDPRYEHEKSVHDNEMKLVERVIELLERGEPLDRADQAVRRIDEVFQNLDAIGELALLVDQLGEDVGLAKAWLRSEVLKGLEASPADPPFDVEQGYGPSEARATEA
jgi:haloalkane dehalogenase